MMSKLQTAIEVHSLLVNAVTFKRQVTGNLSSEAYTVRKKELEEAGLLISSDDELRKVEFSLPMEQDSPFFINLAELLEAPTRQRSAPKEFYIADIKYRHPQDQDRAPRAVAQYINAAKFVTVLTGLADHSDRDKAIFLHGSKLEIKLHYGEADLKALDGLQEFIRDFVDADIHKEQKKTIIKSVLFEMLKAHEIEKLTVPCLLQRFGDFRDRVGSNYQLYVSEFSFEKIREQVEKEKFEFTIKLNKSFSDIQNQLLAVPVALVIVGSQMKSETELTLSNAAIWLGSIVFAIFMSLLIRNQRETVKAIKAELDSQWKSIKSKHLLVGEKLEVHYSQLKNRYWLQSFFLAVVDFVVALSVAGSSLMLLYNSGQFGKFDQVFSIGRLAGLVYFLITLGWIGAKYATSRRKQAS